jgi:hypothetical protein
LDNEEDVSQVYRCPAEEGSPLSYASKLTFISISRFLLFEFPNGEAVASRASRQHLSFREVEFLLTAF